MANPILQRLDKALERCEDWYDVEHRLRESTPDKEIEQARPFVYAFGYELVEAQNEERRQVAGSPFAPMIETDSWQFPPPLKEVDDPIIEAWVNYAESSDNPVALSRLHDLLWERRHGTSHTHARAAISAYVMLAQGEWEPIRRAFCAARALELARALNDRAVISAVAATCLTLAKADLATEEWTPGVALRLVGPLLALPEELQPQELREVVEACGKKYGADGRAAQSVTDLLAALSPAQDRPTLWRTQVQRWRDEAEKANGLLRYTHRQHALQLALNHGLSDLADEIRRDLQRTSPGELDFKEFSAEIEIPADQIDAVLQSVTEVQTWQEGLQRIGVQGPPTGDVEKNEQMVRQAAKDFPLRWLISTQVIGSHRALIFHADSDKKKLRLEMSRQERLSIALFGPIIVKMLKRFAEHFGVPDEDKLAAFLETSFLDSALARRCAAAVGYYWRAEYDAAGHLLAPRLETAIRQMCVEIGIPVTKLPTGDEPGGVVTLGLLLSRLEGHMNESWRRYLCHVLSDALGMNTRNDIGHGLIDQVDQVRAALLLHALLFLRNLKVSEIDTGGY